MKPAKKWLFGVILLLPLLAILKVVFLVFAEPRVTVDYLAEYNRMCRPQNYNPEENAAPHYQKAIEGFIYMPGRLQRRFVDWPADFSDSELDLLENWLFLNSQSFEDFRIAAGKPYCWLERSVKEEGNMFSIMFPELLTLSRLARAMIWEAKLKAMRGEYESAFGNIIDCYRAAGHKCSPQLFLTTQYTGIGIKQNAIRNAFIILDRGGAGSEDLAFFQNILQAELDKGAYAPNMQAEMFLVYDTLQQTFLENGKGTGRLAWSAGWYSHRSSFIGRVKECFLGPTKNQIIEQTEEVLAITDRVMNKTPWQIASEGYDYFGEIEHINRSSFFLSEFGLRPEMTFYLYHKTATQGEALIAVIAILRFKADTGEYPKKLEDLVTAGYLRSVPMDPYSDGALVYKSSADGFELYSIGENFADDGGAIEAVTRLQWRIGDRGGIQRVQPSDIIFWPVIY